MKRIVISRQIACIVVGGPLYMTPCIITIRNYRVTFTLVNEVYYIHNN